MHARSTFESAVDFKLCMYAQYQPSLTMWWKATIRKIVIHLGFPNVWHVASKDESWLGGTMACLMSSQGVGLKLVPLPWAWLGCHDLANIKSLVRCRCWCCVLPKKSTKFWWHVYNQWKGPLHFLNIYKLRELKTNNQQVKPTIYERSLKVSKDIFVQVRNIPQSSVLKKKWFLVIPPPLCPQVQLLKRSIIYLKIWKHIHQVLSFIAHVILTSQVTWLWQLNHSKILMFLQLSAVYNSVCNFNQSYWVFQGNNEICDELWCYLIARTS